MIDSLALLPHAVADPEYGRAFARAVTCATFRLLNGAGRVPQIETPELLSETIWPSSRNTRRAA